MNKYKGINVEFHILQSFPVTCLNRDDVNSPKTAIIGGETRARVSSQAWKRQVRMAMHDFGITLGIRTKHVAELVQKEASALGAEEEKARSASEIIAKVLSKDTLHFFSKTEAKALAEFAETKNYEIDEKKDAKAIFKAHKEASINGFKKLDGLDIALFGRMVAQSPDLNIEGSSVFSHAISTHRVTNEIDFFNALDDVKSVSDSDSGSSHMGSLEFNAATYYRYIALDIGQLVENLGGDEHIQTALEAFTKALYIAVPIARQKTQAGFSPWDYAKVYVRKGQRLQASFDEPVKAKGEGYCKPSIEALTAFLEKKEKLSGSLFGKLGDFTWGLDEQFSIDDLIEGVADIVKQV